jgi:hypothetical protein
MVHRRFLLLVLMFFATGQEWVDAENRHPYARYSVFGLAVGVVRGLGIKSRAIGKRKSMQ